MEHKLFIFDKNGHSIWKSKFIRPKEVASSIIHSLILFVIISGLQQNFRGLNTSLDNLSLNALQGGQIQKEQNLLHKHIISAYYKFMETP
jgi:hypothetical protein